MSHLQAFDIRRVWERVLPGLQDIKAKTNPDWRPEDLYAACVGGRAHLFMPDEASDEFVLLTQGVSVYTGEAYLFVLAAHSKAGNAVAEFQTEIDEIARQAGCSSIEFASPRTGWDRHAKANGYEPIHAVYRRKL